MTNTDKLKDTIQTIVDSKLKNLKSFYTKTYDRDVDLSSDYRLMKFLSQIENIDSVDVEDIYIDVLDGKEYLSFVVRLYVDGPIHEFNYHEDIREDFRDDIRKFVPGSTVYVRLSTVE